MDQQGPTSQASVLSNDGEPVKPIHGRRRSSEDSGGSQLSKASPFGQMLDVVRREATEIGLWNEEMHRDLPKKWEKHGDLIIMPQTAFQHPNWRLMGRRLWQLVAESLNAERLGRKRRIADDEYRTPHIDLMYGRDGWVEHVDNGVRYQYDVTKCMFSIGNITEKLRIATFDCRQEVVVDLFAGIGYFTLPYLVHAHAKHVYAIDWNPDAIEALLRNLEVNKVADRCTVTEGDCRRVSPQGIADRVNLGLIPTARPFWLTGCKVVKPSGGILHIHETLTESKMLIKKLLPAKKGAKAEKPKERLLGSVHEEDSTTNSVNGTMTSPVIEIQTATGLNGVNGNHPTEPQPSVLEKQPVENISPQPQPLLRRANTSPQKQRRTIKKDAPVILENNEKRNGNESDNVKAINSTLQSVDLGTDQTERDSASNRRRKSKSPKPIENGEAVAKKKKSPSPNLSSNHEPSTSENGHNDGKDGEELLPIKRKFSRSASIVEEIENRALPNPRIDRDFLNDKWKSLDQSYRDFAVECAISCTKFLNNIHYERRRVWTCTILRIGKIKSYAPHIDHVVLDLLCQPEDDKAAFNASVNEQLCPV